MSYSGGIISKPIEMPGPLNTILGVGAREDKMYYLRDLCTSPQIKMWAKYKPIAHPSLGELSQADMRNANYGLSLVEGAIQMVTNPWDFMAAYDGDKNGWDYTKPIGLRFGEPFRLLDFNGYKSDVSNPVVNYAARTELIYDPASPKTVNVASIQATVDSTGLSIELNDIKAILRNLLKDYYVTVPDALYFGVILAQGEEFDPFTWTVRKEVSCTPAITKSGGVYQIPSVAFSTSGITETDEGIWTVIPFFSVEPISGGDWSHSFLLNSPIVSVPYAYVTEINITKHTPIL